MAWCFASLPVTALEKSQTKSKGVLSQFIVKQITALNVFICPVLHFMRANMQTMQHKVLKTRLRRPVLVGKQAYLCA